MSTILMVGAQKLKGVLAKISFYSVGHLRLAKTMSQQVENNFWKWFLEAQQELRQVGSASSPVLGELSSALQTIDPDLSYELMHSENGCSELIISANGVRELIPLVDSLVAKAPKVDNWKFTALRPRRALQGASIQCGNTVLSTADLSFSLSVELHRVNITLFLRNNCGDEYYSWLETVFLLLDAAIGERSVADHIGEVFLKELDPEEDLGVKPFVELPQAFDDFLQKAIEKEKLNNSLNLSKQREAQLETVLAKATLLANELSKDLADDNESQEQRATVELHFQEKSTTSGLALVELLANSYNAVAEQIELGSITGPRNWINAYFDIEVSELGNIESLVRELAKQGYQFNCELESACVTWAEESADISSILASLDTLADARLILEAHQELDKNNPAKAVEHLEEALLDDPENLEVRALLAYSYARLSDNDMAEACLDELKQEVSGTQEHPSMFWNIACAYALLAEAQQACENLKLAFELDPELRELAIKDPDLSKLRGQPEFDELLYQA